MQLSNVRPCLDCRLRATGRPVEEHFEIRGRDGPYQMRDHRISSAEIPMVSRGSTDGGRRAGWTNLNQNHALGIQVGQAAT